MPPYPENTTSLTDFGTHIQTYDDALTAVETHQPDAETILRAAEVVIHNDVISLAAMVQGAMDADPENAQAIAGSANFETAYEASRGALPAGVYQATEPGCLIVQGEGQGQHEFDRSLDGVKVDKTYSSSSRSLDVTGLESDTKYYFRSRQVLTKGRYGEWGPWLSNRPL